MLSSSLRPTYTTPLCISGAVSIDPGASLAAGAILQAAPGSEIQIGPGVCLGMGVILNAYQGTIVIESGVTLGPGVLVIGAGTIGENACIGAATTIFNTSVDPMQVIPAGSILGDTSRKVDLDAMAKGRAKTIDTAAHASSSPSKDSPSERFSKPYFKTYAKTSSGGATFYAPTQTHLHTDSNVNSKAENPTDLSEQISNTTDNFSNGKTQANADATTHAEVAPERLEDVTQTKSKDAPVFGQTYVNQLLVTIFPNRE